QLIIDSAIELSKEYKNFQVDFFGKVDEDYQSFHTQVKEYDFLHYKGFIDLRNEKNYEILASYNCMLFPTFWEGDGYAGVLVDAMIAQLPVIASNWNFNKEIINHNQNGWLISPKSKEELQNAMKEIIYNPEILRKFELETIKNISKYDISKAFFDIIKNS
ncbi:glycosyltransferase, partial [uncultured Flavobacterium sp.]|uniref:glycosyltransferase n=1 Tax=uncultured Flavobacterium sp. TaxID=165435 RepID=UPI0030CA401A